MSKRHFIIPDRQVKPGVPIEHNKWLGYAIAEYQPDVLIDLGDATDFPSISSHSKPLERENKRLIDDIEVSREAEELLMSSMGHFVPKQMIKLMGNHEHRLSRYLADNPVLVGTVGVKDVAHEDLGWKFVPYKHGSPQAITIDGLCYAHYFTNVNTGRPIGGTANYKLAAIGDSFVQGHVQGYDIGTKQFSTGRTIRGIVAGSCYLHDEEYKGMANAHWRGAIVLNEVHGGTFSEMPLTMDYLCKKYEGMSLKRYMQRRYKSAKSRFTLAN